MLKGFVEKSEGSEEQKQRQRSMLQQMIQYCENRSDCRRSQVLAYFGETFAKKYCRHTCDNCRSDAVFEVTDFTDYAKAAMGVVKQVQSYSFTMLNCVEVLRGTAGAKTKLARMEGGGNLAEVGYASQVARGEIERLFYRLIVEKAIIEVGVMNKGGFATNYVKLGPKCRDYMTGKVRMQLTVQVPGSTPAQQKSQSTAKYPTFTMLTSPISAGTRRQMPNSRVIKDAGYEQNGFVVSDDNEDYEKDAFEIMQAPRFRGRVTQINSFSGLITTDERLADLSEIHRNVVLQFAQEAKELEEKLRNKAGARRPFFTEANFRDMAISFTVTLDAMHRIPDIKADRVDAYGKRFIPLIQRYYRGYEEVMGGNHEGQDEDLNTNHQNVINLVTNEEDEEEDDEEEEDFGVDPETEAATQLAEKSPFFPATSIASFSRNGLTNNIWTGTLW
ncbi:hypothetical protein IFR05_017120 [Cadophora sp. M221]|nr:hypothetical protein IFR05_017120 [Cadophora sp. M221]